MRQEYTTEAEQSPSKSYCKNSLTNHLILPNSQFSEPVLKTIETILPRNRGNMSLASHRGSVGVSRTYTLRCGWGPGVCVGAGECESWKEEKSISNNLL